MSRVIRDKFHSKVVGYCLPFCFPIHPIQPRGGDYIKVKIRKRALRAKLPQRLYIFFYHLKKRWVSFKRYKSTTEAKFRKVLPVFSDKTSPFMPA